MLLLGDREGAQFIFSSSFLFGAVPLLASVPGVRWREADGKKRLPGKCPAAGLVYCRNRVMPDEAVPPPLEVTVTRFGASTLENVMEYVPGAAGIAGPITPVHGAPVA